MALAGLTLALLVMAGYASGYMFTAMSDVESLLSTETELLRQLNNAIEFEETRLEQLKKCDNFNLLFCSNMV